MPDPIDQPCSHIATEAEHLRDPDYLSCNASAGSLCVWAKRWDGIVDPAYHSERIESAAMSREINGSADAAQFLDDVNR